jgi:hypothetical protein
MTEKPKLDLEIANEAPTEPVDSAEAVSDAATMAIYGMWAGDLGPLRDYLLAGYPLVDFLRHQLLLAIDGQLAHGFYKPLKLEAKGKVGSKTPFTETRALSRALEISDYFEAELPKWGGKAEAAIAATKEQFDVSRTTVTNALRAVRVWKAELIAALPRLNPIE